MRIYPSPALLFPHCVLNHIPKRLLRLRSVRTLSSRVQASDDWETFPENIQAIATRLQKAKLNNYQIQPVSNTGKDFDQRQAYIIAAAARALRERSYGQTVAGRKIGFTNRNIWPEYNIDESNWSYTYDDTVIDLTEENSSRLLSYATGTAELDISHLSNLQPKIEPEVVLGLAHPVSGSMTDAELLQSIEWMAHGFEIVASIFPDWKFTAPDTTAAFALHGLLLVGPKIYVQEAAMRSPERLLAKLTDFKIELYQNKVKVHEGVGSNVLGSPIKALGHLAELLEKDESNPKLSAGESVTTGTLTRALDIGNGDVWSTKISGIELHGLEVQFRINQSR